MSTTPSKSHREPMRGSSLSVVIIAHLEHERIERCLEAVRDWVDEMIVVVQTDDDPTRGVAEAIGARVVLNPWESYQSQRNFALSQASSTWILQLDADEVVSPELHTSIRDFVDRDDPRFSAATFYGIDYFFDRWLRHGENRRVWHARLVRAGCSQWCGGLVHEFQDIQGEVAELTEGLLLHHSNLSTVHLERKHSRYVDLFVAQKIAEGKTDASLFDVVVRPRFRFLKSYLLRRGFLDGFPGYLIARLISHYSFLRYSRLREYSRNPTYRQHIDQIIAESGAIKVSKKHSMDRLLGNMMSGKDDSKS